MPLACLAITPVPSMVANHGGDQGAIGMGLFRGVRERGVPVPGPAVAYGYREKAHCEGAPE